jgi:ketosteroid isomerase-like protein
MPLGYRLFCLVLALTSPLVAAGDREEINSSLDAFHQAAAASDYPAYEALMTDDVVFLGTDGSERWQGDEFREFARPRFERGDGWDYVPVSRNIDVSGNGAVAWFDEALDNDSLGRCRGSGMLLRQNGRWRIAQYNLSVPIPNDLVDGVVAQIAAFEAGEIAPAPFVSPESAEASAAEPEERPAGCAQRRHKTNRKAGC